MCTIPLTHKERKIEYLKNTTLLERKIHKAVENAASIVAWFNERQISWPCYADGCNFDDERFKIAKLINHTGDCHLRSSSKQWDAAVDIIAQYLLYI